MYFGKKYGQRNHDQQQDETGNPGDRRAIQRRHLIYYLRVWDLESGGLLGHVVDINTDGIMLISESEMEVPREYQMEIRWQDPDGEEHSIRFRAQSRWSSNDVNPAFYDTGFLLLDTDETVMEPIRKMIEAYGFQD